MKEEVEGPYSIRAPCLQATHWPVGPMDKASASGRGDSRFESWAGQTKPGSTEKAFGLCMCTMYIVIT